MMEWMLSVHNDVARLPALVWQQAWLSTGWSVVVAWLGVWMLSRWSTRQDAKVVFAVGLALWVWLPGPWGGTHWLGLAFQSPSGVTVLASALLLARMLWRPAHMLLTGHLHSPWPVHLFFLAGCGAALGWALLLDTLGVWPGSLYNWGFGAMAPAVALLITALPWVIAKKALPRTGVVVVATAILLFIASGLPTGNLFDALIDPWLWVFLQIALIQQWRHRSPSALR